MMPAGEWGLTDMTEVETVEEKNIQRLAIAKGLRADLEEQVSVSFPRVAQIAEELKRTHPELAERIDQVVGHSMIRATLLPQMLTDLFWAQTEEPPEVIEGEVVEDLSVEGPEDEIDEVEVQNG